MNTILIEQTFYTDRHNATRISTISAKHGLARAFSTLGKETGVLTLMLLGSVDGHLSHKPSLRGFWAPFKNVKYLEELDEETAPEIVPLAPPRLIVYCPSAGHLVIFARKDIIFRLLTTNTDRLQMSRHDRLTHRLQSILQMLEKIPEEREEEESWLAALVRLMVCLYLSLQGVSMTDGCNAGKGSASQRENHRSSREYRP